jgi:hypothetical protein
MNENLINNPLEFQAFPKMARFSREIIISEKIDGTNAQVLITEYGEVYAGSRTRWITPSDDNYGFAKWVEGNKSEILKLGVGRHFGEWWGGGIQRGYGLKKDDKRFSLFNVSRWCLYGETPALIENPNPEIIKYQDVLPECVGLVPLLYKGNFDGYQVDHCVRFLEYGGSMAVKGYMNPEGIVIYHTAANVGFKKTIKNDDKPKSKI